MKIDFSQKLIGLDDLQMKAGGKGLTLRSVSIDALTAVMQNQKLEGAESFERYQLALKLKDGGMVELRSEEIAKIKKLVGEVFGPAVVGPAFTLLEGGK